MGFCTGNWDDIPPSSAVPPAIGGPGNAAGDNLAASRLFVEWGHSAAASSAGIAAAEGAEGVEDAAHVAGAVEVDATCSWVM